MEKSLSGLLFDLEVALYDEFRALHNEEIEEVKTLANEWEDEEWWERI